MNYKKENYISSSEVQRGMNEKEAQELIKKGYLYVSVMFELVGNPKEHVKTALELVEKNIKQDKEIIWVGHEVGTPEEVEGGMWGAFIDAELLVKDLNKLSWLAFNFAPASIELLDPSELKIKDKELTDFFGDLLSQVHTMNSSLIDIKSKNMALQKNINAILRNTILIALAGKELSGETLGKIIGIPEEQLKPIFRAMIKEKTLVENENMYKRV